MPRTRARKGRAGHRDRKPITFAAIRKPVLRADRAAVRDGGIVGQREHHATLDAFSRRVLGLPARKEDEQP